jgi:arginine-tRNA-protein transferase
LAKEMNLKYLYLGYWVKGSPKMDYKSQYNPLEVFLNGKWLQLDQKVVTQSTESSARSSHAERTTSTIFLPESNI